MTHRRDRRHKVRIQVDCTTQDMFVANRVTNISRGGVFVETRDPLPLDAEIQLTLTLPECQRTIRTVGRVIWNYDIRRGTAHVVPGMGIKFMDMSAADRTLLEEYLARLTRLIQPLSEAEPPGNVVAFRPARS